MAGKIGTLRVGPRDLAALRRSLERLPRVRDAAAGAESDLVRALGVEFDCLEDVLDLLERAIAEDPPAALQDGGVVRPGWAGPDRVRVDMGPPILAPAKIPTTLGTGDGPVLDVPLEIDGETLRVSSVSMGNPHAVVFVEDPDSVPVERWGPLVENHSAFPNRTNVEFVTPLGRDRIRQRTWERGVGETLACGSGACAVAVVAMLRGVVDDEVRIELRGGELEISWKGGGAPVIMTGPAAEVFTGEFPIREG